MPLCPNDVCLCPLYSPVFECLEVRWRLHMYETEDTTRRLICCRRPPAGRYVNGILASRTLQPFIFELIGEISEEDCHLTTDGYGDRTEAPIASCWIKPSPGGVSRIEWAQSARTIHQIVDTIATPWSADVLVSEGNPIHVQLFYEPPEGNNLQESLPIYNRNGVRHPPTSLSEVPFGRTMRFLFTINYSENLMIVDGSRIVYAEIFSVMCL